MSTLFTVLGIIGGLFFGGLWLFDRRTRIAWKRAGNRLGLGSSKHALQLAGEVDGCVVSVQSGLHQGSRTTTFIVRPHDPLPANLGFGAEGILQTVISAVAGRDVVTGDAKFDDAVLVQGDPAVVLAVLSPANRKMVRRLVASGAVLDGGELRLVGREIVSRADRLEGAVKDLLRAARTLKVKPEEVPRRLLDRVKRDPLIGVRRRALELLLAQFPETTEARDAVDRAMADRHPEMRLFGARHGAERAESALVALIHDADPDLDIAVRLEALDLLTERFGADTARPHLVRLLDDDGLAEGAARRLARQGGRSAVEALRSRLDRGDRLTRCAFIDAIGRLGDPRDASLEADLLPLLDEPPLRASVAQALVRLGTPQSIAALLPLTEGMLTDSAVKQAARAAIDAIRQRRGEGPTGGLSVVEETGTGGLTLAEDARSGRLAVLRAEASEVGSSPAPQGTPEQT